VDVGQVDVTDLRVSIPGEHGVDGLRQLRTACFVDTNSIDPDVFEVGEFRLLARRHDLREARPFLRLGIGTLPVLELELLAIPCMRQDSIRRDATTQKLVNLKRRVFKRRMTAVDG
jgi:hypothetical protein